MNTIIWQRLDGTCVCLCALMLFVFMEDGIAWWLAAILFFTPDISFVSYLAGFRFGAVVYNLVHVYAFGTASLMVGLPPGGTRRSGARGAVGRPCGV